MNTKFFKDAGLGLAIGFGFIYALKLAEVLGKLIGDFLSK